MLARLWWGGERLIKNQYLPVGCYGKLPCYGDYIEENLSYPTSRALKNWLHEGREGISLRSGAPGEAGGTVEPRETLRRRILFGLPGSSELAVGVIRPSSDQGGLRPFPFMIVTHFPRSLYGRQYSLLPLGVSHVWDALDDAWDTLAAVASVAAFREVFTSTLVPSPAAPGEARAQYQDMLDQTSSGLFDRNDGDCLEALYEKMPETLAQLRKGGADSGPRLDLPVSRGREAACFDAAFWIDLVNRQFLLKRLEPSLFLEESPPERDGRVLMLFGKIEAADYPLIMGSAGESTSPIRPARSSVLARGETAPRAETTFSEILATRFHAGK